MVVKLNLKSKLFLILFIVFSVSNHTYLYSQSPVRDYFIKAGIKLTVSVATAVRLPP